MTWTGSADLYRAQNCFSTVSIYLDTNQFSVCSDFTRSKRFYELSALLIQGIESRIKWSTRYKVRPRFLEIRGEKGLEAILYGGFYFLLVTYGSGSSTAAAKEKNPQSKKDENNLPLL